MNKETEVKRIYWKEDGQGKGDGNMVFELVDGRKMELVVYGGGETLNQEDAVTDVHFQVI